MTAPLNPFRVVLAWMGDPDNTGKPVPLSALWKAEGDPQDVRAALGYLDRQHGKGADTLVCVYPLDHPDPLNAAREVIARWVKRNTPRPRVIYAERRGKRNRSRLPKLTVEQVLAWAESHHKRCGKWPTANSGPVVDAPGETWKAVGMAMHLGLRGFAGGDSLHRLLVRTGRQPS